MEHLCRVSLMSCLLKCWKSLGKDWENVKDTPFIRLTIFKFIFESEAAGRTFFYKGMSWAHCATPVGRGWWEQRGEDGPWWQKNDTAENQTSLWAWGTEQFGGLGQFFCLGGDGQTFPCNSFVDWKSLGWLCWKRSSMSWDSSFQCPEDV